MDHSESFYESIVKCRCEGKAHGSSGLNSGGPLHIGSCQSPVELSSLQSSWFQMLNIKELRFIWRNRHVRWAVPEVKTLAFDGQPQVQKWAQDETKNEKICGHYVFKFHQAALLSLFFCLSLSPVSCIKVWIHDSTRIHIQDEPLLSAQEKAPPIKPWA